MSPHNFFFFSRLFCTDSSEQKKIVPSMRTVLDFHFSLFELSENRRWFIVHECIDSFRAKSYTTTTTIRLFRILATMLTSFCV